MKNQHLTEEKIIDLIEGNLNEKDSIVVKQHLERCQDCKESYSSWRNILNEHVTLNDIDKDNLWDTIEDQVTEKRVKSKQRNRGWMYGVWVASCFLCIVIGYMFGQQNSTHLTNVDVDDKNIEAFMNEPVEHYNMIHSEAGETQGVAWYNPYQKQMILYLNDPNHLNNRLDEILIQTENRIIPITPNHLHDGRVQFYIEDQHLHDLLHLVVIPEDNIFQQTYYFEMRP